MFCPNPATSNTPRSYHAIVVLGPKAGARNLATEFGRGRGEQLTKFHRFLGVFLAAALLGTLAKRARAEVPARPAEARVAFRSGSEHLAIYRHADTSSSWFSVGNVRGGGIEKAFQRICVAPCEAVLPAGTDTYSVSRTAKREEYPRQIGAITVPAGASTVELVYRDRRAIRHLGRMIGIGGGLGGLIYGGIQIAGHGKCQSDAGERRQLRGAAVGGGVALGSFVVGAFLVSFDDVVDVNVARQNGAFAPTLKRARALSLHGRF
jgi:hypothetical protein